MIVFNALAKEMLRRMEILLEENSDTIDSGIQSYLEPMSIVMVLDKEFSLTKNYPKGIFLYLSIHLLILCV